jgi:hypothetical protein
MRTYERQEKCKEALTETSVQMQMAEKDLAIRVFDVSPKSCDKEAVPRGGKIRIMMAQAKGDCTPSRTKNAHISLMYDIAMQLFAGLNHLHSLDYLHRDIKPENFLWQSDIGIKDWEDCAPGQCRFTLADYGLACSGWNKWSTTCKESIAGTINYMAPEIVYSYLEGHNTEDYWSQAADYWSLGVALIKMWAKRFPGGIGRAYTDDAELGFIKKLRNADKEWWKQWYNIGRDLDKMADQDKILEASWFRSFVKRLLLPNQAERTKEGSGTLVDYVNGKARTEIELQPVCVDPCWKKCDPRDECRANYITWTCVPPVVTRVVVRVTALTDSIYGAWYYADDRFYTIESRLDRKGNPKPFFVENGFGEGELAEVETGGYEATIYERGSFQGTMRLKLSTTGQNSGGIMISQFTDAKGQSGSTVKSRPGENTKQFELEIGYRGAQLRDLKVKVGEEFNLNVKKADFFYDGTSIALEDHEDILHGDHLFLSTHLRNAMVNAWVGPELQRAILDARQTRNLAFLTPDYIGAAVDIYEAWEETAWKIYKLDDVRQAMLCREAEKKHTLSHVLSPHVEKAKKFFLVRDPLPYWTKVLQDLKAPLEAQLIKERNRRFKSTQTRCQTVGQRHCARDVRMTMSEEVDYVKVEYTEDGQETKWKFFKGGRILKTRGDEVGEYATRSVEGATLPGSIYMTITLCKNKLKDSGFISSMRKMLVKETTTSVCRAIGEPISYVLRSNGAEEMPQEAITDTKQMQFQVSGFHGYGPMVAFRIWDGNYDFK